MYTKEVPLYGELVQKNRQVNETLIEEHTEWRFRKDDLDLLSGERHGAIRLGKPEEMAMMARVFAVFGMQPVNFYDLTDAGTKSQPVISTAFRPVGLEDIDACPFRVFASILVPEDRRFFDEETSRQIHRLVDDRDIFGDRLRELVNLAEKNGGLTKSEGAEFLDAATKLFGWRGEAKNKDLYDALVRKGLPIAADIACFPNPHLNHLTPSSLDIDELYEVMKRHLEGRIEKMKDNIEGPPRRNVLMLLRQTSYMALSEPVRFLSGHGEESASAHKARFGEIEQRGVALTPKGRDLYDTALRTAMEVKTAAPIPAAEAFRIIPDCHEELGKKGLAYYTYHATQKGSEIGNLPSYDYDLERLVELGLVEAKPIRYEDFLPVSAAGIVASNLGTGGRGARRAIEEKSPYTAETLSCIIGKDIIDSFDLYAAQQEKSIGRVYEQLRANMSNVLEQEIGRTIDKDSAKKSSGQVRR